MTEAVVGGLRSPVQYITVLYWWCRTWLEEGQVLRDGKWDSVLYRRRAVQQWKGGKSRECGLATAKRDASQLVACPRGAWRPLRRKGMSEGYLQQAWVATGAGVDGAKEGRWKVGGRVASKVWGGWPKRGTALF